MTLSRIMLQMARNPGTEFADGDDRRGYMIVAPLDANGRLDGNVFSREPDKCVVRHFADGEPATTGRLRRRGENWFIDYDASNERPDEYGVHLGDHQFRIGDYVTLRDGEDHAWTYRVADVRPA